jgi:biofilm PGA synthesis N-glycosyltransferase PgaC
MDAPRLTTFIQDFSFGYPFVMAWYWMVGGVLYRLLRGRHEPMFDSPPKLDEYPFVSILLPCHNEEEQADETLTVLATLDYPQYEIIAINDGSTDRTAEILDALVARIPRLRVVHLAQNQGKSTALNVAAHLARGEILVGTDGDALLDRHSLTWFVRRLQGDRRLGGVTGNPRIRNRATLLGQLQVGEFSSIVGLIKRAQSVYGWIFTVSGVMCAFRRRALYDVGFWSPLTLTDDVEVSWRLQLAGWRLAYEPKALCWILMPETLRGLWRQRLRWSTGGTQTIVAATPSVLTGGRLPMLVIWLNYVASILWAYVVVLGIVLCLVDLALVRLANAAPILSPLPGWWGGVMALTYFCQAALSVVLDRRFERGMWRSLFWVVWFPLVFWLLQALTAVVGLPKAIFRRRSQGTWISPDRGIR